MLALVTALPALSLIFTCQPAKAGSCGDGGPRREMLCLNGDHTEAEPTVVSGQVRGTTVAYSAWRSLPVETQECQPPSKGPLAGSL